jgi:uncharacterized membrane protein SpoIIM required for sporulation
MPGIVAYGGYSPSVDLDAYVAEHTDEWARLDELAGRRRLDAAESDELITLYQRAATHLSVVQSRSPDPALVGRLSRLVSRGRAAVTGSAAPAWRDVARFFTVGFPVAVHRAWRWWCGVATGSSLVAFGLMAYIAANPSVQTRLLPPEEIRQLVEHDFANYYSESPAQSFAAQVWTNNALLTAVCLVSGILVLPVLYLLVTNMVSVGVVGGIMIGQGRGDVFWGLITPHGLLEIMCVFVGAGVGLRLGWAWIAPGPRRTRTQALAEEARAGVVVALGLALVLAVTGVIEGFVTPSPLPTWARVGIGVAAFVAFHVYVLVLGRRAARAGETGDLGVGMREDTVPLA